MKTLPGCSPTSPVIVVGPVLVIVSPANTAKLTVVPRFTGGWAAILVAGTNSITTSTSNNVSSNGTNRILISVFTDLSPFLVPVFNLVYYFYL